MTFILGKIILASSGKSVDLMVAITEGLKLLILSVLWTYWQTTEIVDYMYFNTKGDLSWLTWWILNYFLSKIPFPESVVKTILFEFQKYTIILLMLFSIFRNNH